MVPLSQEAFHLLLRRGDYLRAPRLHQDSADRLRFRLRHADHLFLSGRDRHQDHVILVLAGRRLALRRQRPGHRKWNALDADHLANRIQTIEQVVDNRLSK